MGNNIRAILFDLGNTLIHFDAVWPEVIQEADAALLRHLHSQGFAVEEDRFLADFRTRLNRYYAERETEFIEHTTAYILRTVLADFGYPDVSDENLAAALKSLYAVSQSHWQVEDDAHATLSALHADGYRMGIVSNASDDNDVQALVDKAQVRGFLDFVLSSAACGIRKPNPRIFQIAMENWDFPSDEVAMVGDTLGADNLGAQHAGLSSIWLTRRAEAPGNRDHADTIQPDASIARLSHLRQFLNDLK